MTEPAPRYNSAIQRAKGLLELGAALYDTSLSYRRTRSGSPAPQINSRLGTQLSLRLDAREGAAPAEDGGIPLSFGVDGHRANLMAVAEKTLSLLWINPAAAVALAVKGCPPFPGPQPLRAIASFPSWDAAVLAVHESTGITAIEQIRERRYPLRVSTRDPVAPPFDEEATMFAVNTLIGAAGFSFDDIRAWGGSVSTVPRPSYPDRAEAVRSGKIDAIFDEGVLSWGQFAIAHGFRILSVEGEARRRVEAAGYDLVTLTQSRIPGLAAPVQGIDFCGWPMVVHAEMDEDVVWALCEALEARRLAIPTDNYRPLDLSGLCSNGAETPLGAPLHPAAERFYRERGYRH
ncbi:MAG: TAXI family TRAP transporter solute-binding subunit [Stellaceae bacterium]